MRRVRIIHNRGDAHAYAAVDQETGDAVLRHSNRTMLLSLCHRLDWAVQGSMPEPVREETLIGKEGSCRKRRGKQFPHG